MSLVTKRKSPAINPTALLLADAARLLSAAGDRHITAEVIQGDIDAGAPTNDDGTINLIHYTAWLAREESNT